MQYDSVRVTRWEDSGEAAGLLHLFCDKHVTYHRVYRAEEAGLPDLRGHGDSDGDRICLAYNETADIKAVTEYVKATYTDIPVIVMGLSMGGGVAIRSIGENDDIDALITLSASAGVCQECLRTTSNAGRNSRSVRRRHAQGLHGRPGGRWR